MSEKLNIQDIVDLLVARNDISKKEGEKFIFELFNLIDKGLAVDELTKIKDFGTFRLTQIQERESIDVNTKGKIVIPAHRCITFAPAQLLKDLVNKPFAHFETTPLNDGVFMEGIPNDTSFDKGDGEVKYDDAEERADEIEIVNEINTSADKTSSVIAAKKELQADEVDQDEKQDELSALISSSISEINEESFVFRDNLVDDNKEDSSNENITHDTSNHHLKGKSREKRKRYILWWNIAIVLVVILVVGFSYNHYFANNNTSDKLVDGGVTSKAIEGVAVTNTETSRDVVAVVDSIETVKASPRRKAKMSPGRTLRLIALDRLGNKEFWVYIYMINKDKIQNPNIVPVGIELDLPYESEYPIDADNPNEVATAKKLGDDIIKTFR